MIHEDDGPFTMVKALIDYRLNSQPESNALYRNDASFHAIINGPVLHTLTVVGQALNDRGIPLGYVLERAIAELINDKQLVNRRKYDELARLEQHDKLIREMAIDHFLPLIIRAQNPREPDCILEGERSYYDQSPE